MITGGTGSFGQEIFRDNACCAGVPSQEADRLQPGMSFQAGGDAVEWVPRTPACGSFWGTCGWTPRRPAARHETGVDVVVHAAALKQVPAAVEYKPDRSRID